MQIEKLLRAFGLAIALISLAGCGGGGGGSSPTPPPVVVDPSPPAPTAPDFSEVDASFQAFIDERTDFDGISYVLVRRRRHNPPRSLW